MEPDGYAPLRFDAAEPGRSGRGSLARAVSAWRLVQNLSDGDAAVPLHYRNDFEHRVALLADTAPASAAMANTPLGPGVTAAAVTGQSIASLLAGTGLVRAPVRLDVLATFAMAFLGAFLALSFSQLVRSALGALLYLGSAVLGMAAYLVWARHALLAEGRLVACGGPLGGLCSHLPPHHRLRPAHRAENARLRLRDAGPPRQPGDGSGGVSQRAFVAARSAAR